MSDEDDIYVDVAHEVISTADATDAYIDAAFGSVESASLQLMMVMSYVWH